MKVCIKDILIDKNLVNEYKNNPQVLRYSFAMEMGTKFPPIELRKKDNYLIDGMHRISALRVLGKRKVEAIHV